MEHPEYFYKYLSPDTARIVLETGKMRWSCPLLFDDPAEFKRMPRFDPPIDRSFSVCVSELLEIAAGRKQPTYPLSKTSAALLQLFQLLLDRGAREDELRHIALEPITGGDHDAEASLSAWVKSLRIETARVLCVSVDRDNEDLWERYAANHTGVVLKLGHVPSQDTPLMAAVKVDYTEDPPVLAMGHEFLLYGGSAELNARTYQGIFFTKRAQWRAQNEWRALTWRPAEASQYGDYRFVPGELASIAFGRRSTAAFRATLTSLVRNEYPHCLIEPSAREQPG